MSKHTPGPWTICGGYTAKYHAVNSRHGYIVFGMADFQEDRECGRPILAPDYGTQRANARLIAAAPDLLEALREAMLQIEYLHGKFQPTGSGETTLTRGRAAIAKATGDK